MVCPVCGKTDGEHMEFCPKKFEVATVEATVVPENAVFHQRDLDSMATVCSCGHQRGLHGSGGCFGWVAVAGEQGKFLCKCAGFEEASDGRGRVQGLRDDDKGNAGTLPGVLGSSLDLHALGGSVRDRAAGREGLRGEAEPVESEGLSNAQRVLQVWE